MMTCGENIQCKLCDFIMTDSCFCFKEIACQQSDIVSKNNTFCLFTLRFQININLEFQIEYRDFLYASCFLY